MQLDKTHPTYFIFHKHIDKIYELINIIGFEKGYMEFINIEFYNFTINDNTYDLIIEYDYLNYNINFSYHYKQVKNGVYLDSAYFLFTLTNHSLLDDLEKLILILKRDCSTYLRKNKIKTLLKND